MSKAIYLEAPNELETVPKGYQVIFIAGGITGVENWQARAAEVLHNLPNVLICNPRRKDFEVFKGTAGYAESKRQIVWEKEKLDLATQIIFWFGKETVQPIVMFELGSRIKSGKQLFIGAHPEYPRRFDLQVQLPLYGYELPFVETLEDLLQMVTNYNRLLAITV